MTNHAITIPADDQALGVDRRAAVGAAADQAAREGVFADYAERRAANTLRRQRADLASFARYLAAVQFHADADALQTEAAAWGQITHGLIAGFVRWLLQQGYALGTINVKLSTVKQYAGLAFQAGAIDPTQHALIRGVAGYQYKEQSRVDEKRSAAALPTRKGAKKAEAVSLTAAQVKVLKRQPETAQGRRDALLLCLLLDHGLRVGEVAALEVTAVNLTEGTLTFYRPKVGKTQTHQLSPDALKAAQAWFTSGDAPAVGPLLRASTKGGALGPAGVSERALTKRVNYLGKRIGVEGLSAHDLRHSWATRAARNKTSAFALQDAGGWNSLAMPARYVEAAKIANEGVNLGEE